MNKTIIISDLNDAFSRMAQAAQHAIAPFQAFGLAQEQIYKDAAKIYRAQYKSLPGSESTKRLRKKRRTIVMNWFYDETTITKKSPASST